MYSKKYNDWEESKSDPTPNVQEPSNTYINPQIISYSSQSLIAAHNGTTWGNQQEASGDYSFAIDPLIAYNPTQIAERPGSNLDVSLPVIEGNETAYENDIYYSNSVFDWKDIPGLDEYADPLIGTNAPLDSRIDMSLQLGTTTSASTSLQPGSALLPDQGQQVANTAPSFDDPLFAALVDGDFRQLFGGDPPLFLDPFEPRNVANQYVLPEQSLHGTVNTGLPIASAPQTDTVRPTRRRRKSTLVSEEQAQPPLFSGYPPFQCTFSTVEAAQNYLDIAQHVLAFEDPTVFEVRQHMSYWVGRIYEAMVDLENVEEQERCSAFQYFKRGVYSTERVEAASWRLVVSKLSGTYLAVTNLFPRTRW